VLDITYPPVIAAARVMFAGLNLKFDKFGEDNLPRKGGVVLASNHVSYLDFIFCGYAAQPSKRLVRFMAKKSTFDNRISGPMMRSMHHIPVDRAAGADAFGDALTALRDGEVVGVFPEATISQSFEPKDFKTGAVRLAADAGVPVVPMITFGGQRLWTKGHKRDMERGTTVSLYVGEPMEVTPSDDPVVATEELRSRMEKLYEQLIAAYPDTPAPDQAADTWWWPARFGGGAPTLADMKSQEAAERKSREAHD
jgi:1-acyl-sn-glycerol-3-phosphate acyltransferase